MLSVRSSCEEHDVVSEHAEIALALPRGVGTTAQCRAQETLVPREGTLRLPALTVLSAVEAPLHLPAILGPRPLAALVPFVDRNHRRTHGQVFSTEPMVLFAVEGRIAEHA